MGAVTMNCIVKKGESWRNKKTLQEYEVLAIGICCDNDKNNQASIIYTAGGELNTRCEHEFVQKFVKVEE